MKRIILCAVTCLAASLALGQGQLVIPAGLYIVGEPSEPESNYDRVRRKTKLGRVEYENGKIVLTGTFIGSLNYAKAIRGQISPSGSSSQIHAESIVLTKSTQVAENPKAAPPAFPSVTKERRPANLSNGPLHQAVISGNILEAKKLIKENPENIDLPGLYDWTPLHWAGKSGNLEMIKELIDLGANVNSHDSLQQSPLVLSISSGNPEAVKLLISKGADKEVHTKIDSYTPLFFAAGGDSLAVLKELVSSGVDLTVKSAKGITPMDYAANLGKRENVLFLKEKTGVYTILHAAGIGDCEGAKKIIQADPQVGAWTKTQRGLNALHVAVNRKDLEMVKLLLEAGFNINALDDNASTPLMIIQWQKDEKAQVITKFLKEHGATMG